MSTGNTKRRVRTAKYSCTLQLGDRGNFLQYVQKYNKEKRMKGGQIIQDGLPVESILPTVKEGPEKRTREIKQKAGLHKRQRNHLTQRNTVEVLEVNGKQRYDLDLILEVLSEFNGS